MPAGLARKILESSEVLEQMPVESGHGVKAQKFQADRAEVNALHRPIAQAGGAEGAAVAATVVQNAPGVAEASAIFPYGFGDVFIGVGMLLIESIGDEADPIFGRWARVLAFGGHFVIAG